LRTYEKDSSTSDCNFDCGENQAGKESKHNNTVPELTSGEKSYVENLRNLCPDPRDFYEINDRVYNDLTLPIKVEKKRKSCFVRYVGRLRSMLSFVK